MSVETNHPKLSMPTPETETAVLLSDTFVRNIIWRILLTLLILFLLAGPGAALLQAVQ